MRCLCAGPAVLTLRYCIRSTFIKRRSGPSRSLCAWLHSVILFRPRTFAFRSPLTSILGFRVFPPAASLIAAPAMIASPGSEWGGSAHRTCCQIKGHSWRSGIIGEEGNLYFLSFFFCFSSPHNLPACTPTPPLGAVLTLRC